MIKDFYFVWKVYDFVFKLFEDFLKISLLRYCFRSFYLGGVSGIWVLIIFEIFLDDFNIQVELMFIV